MSREPFHQTRLLNAPSNLALNTAREGAATASLGNLGQCFTTLMVKNFFLISNLNLPSFSSKPSPLVLSLHPLVRSPSPALSQAPSGTGSCSKVSPQPSLLQGDQPQLSQQRGSSPQIIARAPSGPAPTHSFIMQKLICVTTKATACCVAKYQTRGSTCALA